MTYNCSVEEVYNSVFHVGDEVSVDPSQFGDILCYIVEAVGPDRFLVQFTSGVTMVLYSYQLHHK